MPHPHQAGESREEDIMNVIEHEAMRKRVSMARLICLRARAAKLHRDMVDAGLDHAPDNVAGAQLRIAANIQDCYIDWYDMTPDQVRRWNAAFERLDAAATVVSVTPQQED
jgi:hypothetical protein